MKKYTQRNAVLLSMLAHALALGFIVLAFFFKDRNRILGLARSEILPVEVSDHSQASPESAPKRSTGEKITSDDEGKSSVLKSVSTDEFSVSTADKSTGAFIHVTVSSSQDNKIASIIQTYYLKDRYVRPDSSIFHELSEKLNDAMS